VNVQDVPLPSAGKVLSLGLYTRCWRNIKYQPWPSGNNIVLLRERTRLSEGSWPSWSWGPRLQRAKNKRPAWGRL